MQSEQQVKQTSAPITNKPEKFIGLRKFHYYFLMFAVVLVPFWFAFGSYILGAPAGYGLLASMIFFSPILLIYQVIILSLTLMNRKSKENKKVSLVVGVLLSVYYFSLVMYKLITGDTGGNIDTADSLKQYNSVSTNLLGVEIGNYLASFAGIVLIIITILAITIFVVLLAELVTKKDNKIPLADI